MSKIPAYYWDACVFIAHLKNERAERGHLIDHIQQFLDEAQAGKCQIFTSTITVAEITTSTFAAFSVGSFAEFMRDFQSSIVPVTPDPNTMSLAAHLRSQEYTQGRDGRRSLATPDAIHLATAININEIYGVTLDAFHTFDSGKSRGIDGGRGMPMLGFEAWTSGCAADRWIKKVVALNRSVPAHPTPLLVV